MSPEELFEYVERVVAFINEDKVPARLVLAGDGIGQVRPSIGVLLDQPDLQDVKYDTGGVLYELPFQVTLVVLPAPALTKRDALLAALVLARNAMQKIRRSHQFDDLRLSKSEPISFINVSPNETVLGVNYAATVVV